MKTKIAGIVCVLVLVGAWVYVHAEATNQPTLPAGTNGRYQVVPVEFDSWTAGEPSKKKVIRIDTQTGQTWRIAVKYPAG